MAKIWLSNDPSDVSGFLNAYVNTRSTRSTALATSLTSYVVAAAAGTTTSVTGTAGGTALKWLTKPFATAVTIAGSVGVYAWMSANSTGGTGSQQGLNVLLNLHSGGSETVTPFLVDLVRSQPAKTAVAQFLWLPTAPTSQAFAVGDRLAIHLNLVTLASSTPNGVVTLDYNAQDEGIDGNTYIQVTENIRVGSRQSTASGGASALNESRGQIQEALNSLNQYVATAVISSSASVQSAIDDLGKESANN